MALAQIAPAGRQLLETQRPPAERGERPAFNTAIASAGVPKPAIGACTIG